MCCVPLDEAGPCDPDRCVVSGDALGNCNTGTPLRLQLQAADRYGNPRSMGGDLVEASCKPRDGGARVEADVRDNGDGTYALTVILDQAVHHDVHVNVNGLSDRESRFFLSPALAGPDGYRY
jgi:filamin